MIFFHELQAKATSPHSSPRTAAMQLKNGERVLDASRPTFNPHLDIATLVFSHVQCVNTRGNLAVVSKLWRDASKTAAAYPRTLDWGGFRQGHSIHVDNFAKFQRIVSLLDNDEALSMPYERVVELLDGVCDGVHWVHWEAAFTGSVRLLKWTRENNLTEHWDEAMCHEAAQYGHLPALQYLHENGCPWDQLTCKYAAVHERWDCFQYLVDNKCPGWEKYAERYAEHLR